MEDLPSEGRERTRLTKETVEELLSHLCGGEGSGMRTLRTESAHQAFYTNCQFGAESGGALGEHAVRLETVAAVRRPDIAPNSNSNPVGPLTHT